jgi:hypothetical protein
MPAKTILCGLFIVIDRKKEKKITKRSSTGLDKAP